MQKQNARVVCTIRGLTIRISGAASDADFNIRSLLRGLRCIRLLDGALSHNTYPTVTMYSVGMDRRSRARLAGSNNSRTVSINSSTVSGVKDASPSSGQTQAWMLGTRIETPSSLYSKVVERHSLGVWCSPHIGIGWLVIYYFFFLLRRRNDGLSHSSSSGI
jgi:hypothetical protein